MAYTTRQHQAVLQCLKNHPQKAFSAAEVAAELHRSGKPVGLATIYRQLDKLEAEALIHKIPTEDGALYQYCPQQADHSCALLRCEQCGQVIHLDCHHLQGLCSHLEGAHGFRIDLRRTVLTGLCGTCGEKEACHGAN